MNKLNIFVSSTCYDLSQIRADLFDFIVNLGHNPILSEYSNFPVNPSKNTITNCIDAVKNSADIFILIIGNKYGNTINNGKSITNSEFLAARNKGIPIYVFILKPVLNIIPIWKTNKNADYSSVIDNPAIFEFICEIREDNKIWSYEFEKVQEITNILRTQFSFLFKESITLAQKFRINIHPFFYDRLSNNALRVILEKKELYEIEFFCQIMYDEILKFEDLKNDYDYGIVLDSKNVILNEMDLAPWLQQRIHILSNAVEALNKLMNTVHKKYWGEPGVLADLKGLFYVAKTYARIFQMIINSTIETLGAVVDDEFTLLRQSLSKISTNLIEQIWDFPFYLVKSFEDIEKRHGLGETINIKLVLTLDIDKDALAEYNAEINKLLNRLKQ